MGARSDEEALRRRRLERAQLRLGRQCPRPVEADGSGVAPMAPASSEDGHARRTAEATSAREAFASRAFTRGPGVDPLDEVVYERRSSSITNPDGSIVFKMDGAEVPASWSQLATDIVISKYFRKAGLYGDKDKGETSVRQVVRRIAHTIRQAADEYKGYFATKA